MDYCGQCHYQNICWFTLAIPSGTERREVKKLTERVEAGLLVHLSSAVETQLWMRKRHWPEGNAAAVSIHPQWTN